MKKVIVKIALGFFAMLVVVGGYNNCGGVNFTKTYSTIMGNPKNPTQASQEILFAICSVLNRCQAQVAIDVCMSGVKNTNGIGATLGLPLGVDDPYSSLMAAESAGQLVANPPATNSCAGAINTLSCSIPAVINAYNQTNSNPFSDVPAMIPQSSCSAVFTNEFVYVGDANASGAIAGFSMNTSTGELTPLSVAMPTDVTAAGMLMTSVTLSSGQTEIIDTTVYGGGTYGYLVNPTTGALTEVQNSPISGAIQYGFGRIIPTDPLGRLFYGAFGGDNVYSSLINPLTGAFPSSVSTAPSGNGPGSIAVDKTGNYIYVADFVTGDVRTYSVNTSTGALTGIATYATTAGSGVTLLIDPYNRFLFDVVGLCASNDLIYSFKINGDGTLTPNGSINGTDEMCQGILGSTLDNAGQVLYEGPGPTNIYSINQVSGALTNIGSVASGGFQTVDPTNQYWIVAGSSIASYSGVATGSLVATGNTGPASNSIGVAFFDPTGKFIYSLDANNNFLWEYKFNSSNGSFTAVPNSPISLSSPRTMTFVKVLQ